MSAKSENLITQFQLYKNEESSGPMNLDIQFAKNLVNSGGKFFYCENKIDCIRQLKKLKEEKNWNYIHSWEENLKSLLRAMDFQKDQLGYHLDNSNAAISSCESLVAESGAILLAPKQSARRCLSMFPPSHIIIAETSRLFETLEDAVEDFLLRNKDELPSILELSKSSGWKTSVKNVPVLYAEGPTDVYIFLCDEEIH